MSDSPSLSLPDGPLREAYLQLHAYYSLRRGHEQAFDSLTRFLLAAATSDSHKGHLVIGPSGSGKTRLLRQLYAWLRSHLCVPDDKPDPMPVVSMTTNMTPKSLVQACMKAGGDPLAMLGTQNQTESRMSHLGRILFKNGLAIDEFHQSIDGKSARDRMAMAMLQKGEGAGQRGRSGHVQPDGIGLVRRHASLPLGGGQGAAGAGIKGPCVAVGIAVMRRVASLRDLAGNIGAGAETGVGEISQLAQRGAIGVHARRLAQHRFVPGQPQPFQVQEYGFDEFIARACPVDVLDAQDKIVTLLKGGDGGKGVPQVQQACRRRREAGNNHQREI